MHTPTYHRRWNYELGHPVAQGGSALATNRALWLGLVGYLLSIPGVTVYRSCDSVAAGTAGDGVNRWDTDTDLVWGAGAHSWMVLALPAGLRYPGGTCYLTIDFGYASANGTLGAVYLAETVSGGSTTARPTGTKEILLNTTAGGALLPTPTVGYELHVVWSIRSAIDIGDGYETDAIRVLVVDPAGPRCCSTMVLELPAADSRAPEVDSPIGGWDYVAAGDSFSPLDLSTAISLRTWIGSSRDLNVLVSVFDGNYLEEGGGYDHDTTGRAIFYPARIARASGGYICTLTDLYFVDGATMYTLYPGGTGATSRTWVAIGNLAVPNEPDSDSVGSPASETPITLGAGTGAFLVALDPVNGASLGATREAARWAPISITLTVATGAPLVFGHFGSDPGIRHVIYDGAAFTPLFEDGSTMTRNGDVYTFTILPLGGWWDTPTIRAGAFAEAVA